MKKITNSQSCRAARGLWSAGVCTLLLVILHWSLVISARGQGTVPVTRLDQLRGDVTLTSPSNGQVLRHNGTRWVNATGSGTGTVTSVALTLPSGLSVSGSPITSTGTLAVTTTLSGILKGTGSGFTAATAGTDYISPADTGTVTNTMLAGSIADAKISSAATWNAKESALTFGTGLTRAVDTITVNTAQNIARLSNLTSNGVVQTTGGDGTLAVSGTFSGTSSGTNTGDQTITLTGDVTGSGTGSFAAAIGASKVTDSMLAGSITPSKITGTAATLGANTFTGAQTITDATVSTTTGTGALIVGGGGGFGGALNCTTSLQVFAAGWSTFKVAPTGVFDVSFYAGGAKVAAANAFGEFYATNSLYVGSVKGFFPVGLTGVSTNGTFTVAGLSTHTGGIAGGVQTLSGAGAVNVTTLTTKLTSTGTGDALTLANGTNGQLKKIVYAAEGAGADTMVLTPTTKTGYSTITLDDVADAVSLIFFTTQGWMIDSNYGCTVAP